MLRMLAVPAAFLAVALSYTAAIQTTTLGQGAGPQAAAQQTAWEYELDGPYSHVDPNRLNALGAQGWDLVDVWIDTDRNSQITLVYKRPK